MTPLDRIAALGLRAAGATSRWVETDVARHHVYDARGRGALPPVVFLPGLGDAGASLAPVILRLRAAVRRVIVVEAAGHGRSGPARAPYTIERHVASVADVLDAVLDEPAILAGNSLGGATALRYAADRPARVRGVYVTSPGGAPLDAATLADLRATFAIRTTADARRFLGRVIARPSATTALLAPVVRARARAGEIGALLASLGDHAVGRDELARIRAPITLVWGRAERVLPAAALAYWRAHLPPHADVVEPAGLGHCPHLDDPRRLARLIAAFAARAAAAPARRA